jgi:transcriptional regulator GlxA family with amidase domain
VVDQLNTPDLELPPLVADQMLRLVSGSLLRAFPNTTMTTVRAPAPGRAVPAVVRRAVAYMDAHAERPVALAEVAAAAGVGVRTLQVAFRRHLDLTPLAYLRRVRLHRAHRDLVAAEPGDGSTVGKIARRWGFAKASRFTAVYQSTFGELPSHTLRT